MAGWQLVREIVLDADRQFIDFDAIEQGFSHLHFVVFSRQRDI